MPTLVVATKMDKLSKHKRKPALAALAQGHGLDPAQIVAFSSKDGFGRTEVWDHIEAACRGGR